MPLLALLAVAAHAPALHRPRLARAVQTVRVSLPARALAASDADAAAQLPPALLPPPQRRRTLDRELRSIALPSLAALSCENLLSLVDTLYLGRLGAAELGAAGIGIAATYSIAKLFGDPLTKTSTSLVAGAEGDALLSSVIAALALALFLGLVQTAVFTAFAPKIVAGFGASAGSPLAAPAAAYLRLRSIGAPAVTLQLVMQGLYRGLGDTLTPLLCTLAGAAVNAARGPRARETWRCIQTAAQTRTPLYCARCPAVSAALVFTRCCQRTARYRLHAPTSAYSHARPSTRFSSSGAASAARARPPRRRRRTMSPPCRCYSCCCGGSLAKAAAKGAACGCHRPPL